MIRFRPHHLICLQFYKGEGYTEEFVSALNGLMDRSTRERVQVTTGADDLCAVCPYLRGGTCEYEDDISRIDDLALKLLCVSHGDLLNMEDVKDLLPSIMGQWREKSCIPCAWLRVCEGNDYYRGFLPPGEKKKAR